MNLPLIITSVVVGIGFFSLLAYQFINWKAKRELIKLQEGYKKEDDKSRKSGIGNEGTEDNFPVIPRESIIERNEPVERGELLQTSDSEQSGTDKPEPIVTQPEPIKVPRRRFFNRKPKEVKQEEETIDNTDVEVL